jgi:glyoxylase-like metal-dependent hydrolase (beta-lactamase superfamily II)
VQEGSRYLVDCGYEHSLSQISSQLENHGFDIRDIDGIILTHDDIYHLSGLYEIRQAFPSIKVYCSETEAPYISRELKSLRLRQAEEYYEQLPDDQGGWAHEFQHKLRAIRRVPVDIILPDESDFGSDIKIIHNGAYIDLYTGR